MKIIVDGERSRLRFGFAKNLFRKVKALGLMGKTLMVDGFRISVRTNPPEVKIVAPAVGAIVTCAEFNATVWFMSEGLGNALIGHPLMRCANFTGGVCTSRVDISNTTLVNGATQVCPVGISGAWGEFINVVGAYDRTAAVTQVYGLVAHAYGGLQEDGIAIYPQTAYVPTYIDYGIGSVVEVGPSIYLAVGTDNSSVANSPASTALAVEVGNPIRPALIQNIVGYSRSVYDLTSMLSGLQTVASTSMTPFTSIDHTCMVTTTFDGTYTLMSVFLVFGYRASGTTYYFSGFIDYRVSVAGGLEYMGRRVLTGPADPTVIGSVANEIGYNPWTIKNCVGAPFAHKMNMIQFHDAGVSVVWGLWDVADPTSKGWFAFDHVPITNPTTGQSDQKYDFLNPRTSPYSFPAEFFTANMRAEYVRFPVSGADKFFLVFRQFASATAATNTVHSVYLGTPWGGWTTAAAIPAGFYDVRLTSYDTTGASDYYELTAVGQGVGGIFVQQYLHNSTAPAGTVVDAWVAKGKVDPLLIPATPEGSLWSVGLYGDGYSASNARYGRIPAPAAIPTPWGP